MLFSFLPPISKGVGGGGSALKERCLCSGGRFFPLTMTPFGKRGTVVE